MNNLMMWCLLTKCVEGTPDIDTNLLIGMIALVIAFFVAIPVLMLIDWLGNRK